MERDEAYLYLKKSLENQNNIPIYNLTWKDIREMIDNIVTSITSTKEEKQTLLSSLTHYRYVDNLNDLRDGSYIRWIRVNPGYTSIWLNKGAICCNVNITEKGAGIVCKYMRTGKYFILQPVEEYIIFQKLSNQEMTLLNAIEAIRINT